MIAFVTATERARFIAELEVTGNVTFACEAAGITRSAAYDEREACPDFDLAWRAAQGRARRALELRAVA